LSVQEWTGCYNPTAYVTRQRPHGSIGSPLEREVVAKDACRHDSSGPSLVGGPEELRSPGPRTRTHGSTEPPLAGGSDSRHWRGGGGPVRPTAGTRVLE
jgi:hypothetical protein